VPTPLPGAYVIETEPVLDERGFFVRTYCRREFAARGIDFRIEQASTSYNARANTLRGLHFQAAPHAEAKLVSCTRGALFDVIVDLRPRSATYSQWYGVELGEREGRMMFVPEGFAHGFQTLVDHTLVAYGISTAFEPSASRGVRWDDPELAVAWPNVVERIISDRDRTLPLLAAYAVSPD
jgi:dTDP-4-dehydrorhamnose 3,5-epimerase